LQEIKKILYMKILLLLLFTTPIICFSQTSFSCNLKEFCDWNEYKETWENDCNSFEYNCLFVMNKDETMFVHTTATIKSTYFVKKSRYTQEQADENFFAYDVVSDVGNEYYFIFDMANKEVKTITKDENGNSILIRYYVKSIF